MWMQATATAMVECTSDDEDAFLCASVSVSSEAFANTTVAAHVSAMATALDGCACMGSSISSFITAEAFISLVAEATATATASACISGARSCLQAAGGPEAGAGGSVSWVRACSSQSCWIVVLSLAQ